MEGMRVLLRFYKYVVPTELKHPRNAIQRKQFRRNEMFIEGDPNFH